VELEISEMFKALAVETRVKILELLKSRGPLGAKEIGKLLGITPAAASQRLHLRVPGERQMERERIGGIAPEVPEAI
jgi:DNA-binding transcriptional ArsR family regulator